MRRKGCVQGSHQPRTAHRWQHTRAYTYTQPAAARRRLGSSPRARRTLQSGMWRRHSWGWKLEWEEGRERRRRLGSHILDLWSVSAVLDFVLWVSM